MPKNPAPDLPDVPPEFEALGNALLDALEEHHAYPHYHQGAAFFRIHGTDGYIRFADGVLAYGQVADLPELFSGEPDIEELECE